IQGSHFQKMREGATFVNTGRGATVIEDEMIEVLTARPDLTALLDVTDPEPLPPEHPLRKLPNVVITPHTSGAGAYGYSEIGNTVVHALEQYFYNKPVPGRVDLTRWAQLA
ncbi:MAG: NAD(P)-dependent oxidoreductase, partial [Candidatus Latescibacteria bacterium]|nr:NAD(P)-dependent oxidoreductase [Candidatus Latescibacterota bacterium]